MTTLKYLETQSGVVMSKGIDDTHLAVLSFDEWRRLIPAGSSASCFETHYYCGGGPQYWVKFVYSDLDEIIGIEVTASVGNGRDFVTETVFKKLF